jgi:hypothetical protein
VHIGTNSKRELPCPSVFSAGATTQSHHLFTRRHVVKGGAAAIAAMTAAPSPAQVSPLDDHPPTVIGVVFEDLSGTAMRQPGDPGIPGVLVSNGRDVVRPIATADTHCRWLTKRSYL